MTLKAHELLEDYFQTIINKPRIVYFKETTMFDKTKMFFTQQIEKINSLLTKPTAFVETEDPTLYEDGYWAFEMYTPEWINEYSEKVEPVHTVLVEPHDGTWMEVLDRILDEMEKHYGYNIKEQVYYSVNFPNNEPSPYTGEIMAGYSRMLNDGIFQQLLLAFPEVYERDAVWDKTKDVFK